MVLPLIGAVLAVLAFLGLAAAISSIMPYISVAVGVLVAFFLYLQLEERGYIDNQIVNAGVAVAAGLLMYKMLTGLLLAAGFGLTLLILGVVFIGGTGLLYVIVVQVVDNI